MNSIKTILNELGQRRRDLGLSYKQLADRTGLSLQTIQRLLGGRCTNAQIRTVAAVAEILGAEVGLIRKRPINTIRREQASRKAKKLVQASQASAALEGQAVEKETLKKVERVIMERLLAGPKVRLWS